MIKDQEALAIWMAKRAQLNRAREISRIAQERLARSSQGGSIDWIEAHRPMRSIGQSWEMSEASYAPMAAPKIIRAGR